MAGHSKGDGQKPTGLYVPNKQVTGVGGAGGSAIRPAHVQQELQAISRATKILSDRIANLEDTLELAGLLTGSSD